MDKIIGLLTVIFVGIPLTIISMILSWKMNEDMDKGQFDDDSDVRIYRFVRDRKHRGMDRHTKGDK